MINDQLIDYIEKNIYPENNKNESGHNMEHIKYVINRSIKFAEKIENINYNMVFTIAAYHDIGHHIDYKNHEIVSAKILENDKNLSVFFNKDEIKIMKEAIEDHRASLNLEPRSIYGKIVSSADRNTDIEQSLKRTYSYRLEHNNGLESDEIIEESRLHLINKFCKNGYATNKMYFEDTEYKIFLEEIEKLCNDKEEFYRKYKEINNIKKND